jgi:hypothetical protein
LPQTIFGVEMTKSPKFCSFAESPRASCDKQVETCDQLLQLENPWKWLQAIRNEGWRVAVHNDYVLAGESYTFWAREKQTRKLSKKLLTKSTGFQSTAVFETVSFEQTSKTIFSKTVFPNTSPILRKSLPKASTPV